MRKPGLYVLVAVILLIGTGLPVAAQVDAVGIMGYNKYSFDWGGIFQLEPFNSGFGGTALVRYWLTDSIAIGAGVDYLRGSGRDSVSSTYWYDLDGDLVGDILVTETLTLQATLSSLGLLAVAAGRVSVGANLTLEPFVGIGSYGASLQGDSSYTIQPIGISVDSKATLTADRQMGYLVGARVDLPVTPGMRIGGVAGYRGVGEFTSGTAEVDGGPPVEFDNVSGFNVSGFFGGLTVSMGF